MNNTVHSKHAYWHIPTVVFHTFLNLLHADQRHKFVVRKRAQLLTAFGRYTLTLTVTGSKNANMRIETQPRKS